MVDAQQTLQGRCSQVAAVICEVASSPACRACLWLAHRIQRCTANLGQVASPFTLGIVCRQGSL